MSDINYTAAFVDEDGLFHYGVLGMKWRKRKKKPITTTKETIVRPKSESLIKTNYRPPNDYKDNLRETNEGWVGDVRGGDYLFGKEYLAARQLKYNTDIAVGAINKPLVSTTTSTGLDPKKSHTLAEMQKKEAEKKKKKDEMDSYIKKGEDFIDSLFKKK